MSSAKPLGNKEQKGNILGQKNREGKCKGSYWPVVMGGKERRGGIKRKVVIKR